MSIKRYIIYIHHISVSWCPLKTTMSRVIMSSWFILTGIISIHTWSRSLFIHIFFQSMSGPLWSRPPPPSPSFCPRSALHSPPAPSRSPPPNLPALPHLGRAMSTKTGGRKRCVRRRGFEHVASWASSEQRTGIDWKYVKIYRLKANDIICTHTDFRDQMRSR